jgi:hypothetical protein
MQQKHLYEYAMIRVVPVVERKEFINVGVILLCKKEKYLRILLDVNEDRIKALYDKIDLEQLKENLHAFSQIANGKKGCGPIAEMDETSRFRWLTAVKSASIQTSRPHPGLSDNLDATTQKLFDELVRVDRAAH